MKGEHKEKKEARYLHVSTEVVSITVSCYFVPNSVSLFLRHMKCCTLLTKLSPKFKGSRAKNSRRLTSETVSYTGSRMRDFFTWKSAPALFSRPTLRPRGLLFHRNGSWFIAGIFLQSTCRPRGQQLTRVYATRIELQCFSVTIVRVAMRCTPRTTHINPVFVVPRIRRYSYATFVRNQCSSAKS